MTRRAVVLFNLGGPDRPESVQPFLFNLFNDPAIIGLPGLFRWVLAHFISRRRAPIARDIYAHLGGKSPLLELTRQQAGALEAALSDETPENADPETRVFVCMRYWHPMTDEVVAAVKDFAPDQVVLLPLYPQYSTTTSGSSIALWKRRAAALGLAVPTVTVCCYPDQPQVVAATARLVGKAYDAAKEKSGGARSTRKSAHGPAHGPVRVLFSAHGLPEKVIKGGDPYQWQVELTASAVVQEMGRADLDWLVCYQSRVGPLKWIGPSTEAEIERAGRDGVSLVVCPIAFVSEHSETLVELDIEYAELAKKSGVPVYERVPTPCSDVTFIKGLAALTRRASDGADGDVLSGRGARICPGEWGRCPCRPGGPGKGGDGV